MEKKVVKVFPVAFKLINMYDSYGLYAIWKHSYFWCLQLKNAQ